MAAAPAARLEAFLSARGELLLGLLLGLDLVLGEVLVLVSEVGLVEDELGGLALVLGRGPDRELGVDGRRLLGSGPRALRLLLLGRGAVGLLLRKPTRPAFRLALLRLLAVTGQAD
jgi:hypothetical protein